MNAEDVQASSRERAERDPAAAWCLLHDLLGLADEWMAAEFAGDAEMAPTAATLAIYYGLVRELAGFVHMGAATEALPLESSAEARELFGEHPTEAWRLLHDLTELAHQELVTATSNDRRRTFSADPRWADTMTIAAEACAEVKRTALLTLARVVCLAHLRATEGGS